MNIERSVDMIFIESDEEKPKQQIEQESVSKFRKVFVTALILELINLKCHILSRNDVITAIQFFIKQQKGECSIRNIDVVLQPILSTSAIKCCAIIEVNEEIFENLIKLQPEPIVFGNKTTIFFRFEFSFFDFNRFDKSDILSNGRFQKEFTAIKVEKESIRKTQIIVALNNKDQQIYALKKVALPGDISWQKLYYQQVDQIREVQAMLRLQHRNVARLFSWWIECEINDKKQNRLYLYQQQEYVSYKGFNNLLQFSLGYLKQQQDKKSIIKKLIPQILDGMEYINSQGFFHRDIKLENILVTSDFSKEMVIRICDFDWSKTHLNEDGVPQKWAVQSRQTGDPHCSSLKSCQGSVYDFKEELYQFGILFLDLCYFNNDNEKVLDRKKLHDDVKEKKYPENLNQQFQLESEIIKNLIYQQKYKNIGELKKSDLFLKYLQQ